MLDLKGDPLLWWQVQQSELPVLAGLAKRYLAIPPTSVTSERIFKTAKLANRDKPRLKPRNCETLVFLNYNCESMGYPISLPEPPTSFVPPNGQ